MNASLSEIATWVHGRVVGDEHLRITELSPIEDIAAHSLVFADGADNLKHALASPAAAIIVPQDVHSADKPIIQVANPFRAFITLLDHFYPKQTPKPGIHPTAVIGDNVFLGQQVSIGPYVIIESGSKIGDGCVLKSHVHIGHQVHIGPNCTLYPHVVVYDGCHLGARVSIHASSVIGSDGFGYTAENGRQVKVPHVGCVIIEDDVEIGASTIIDRATLGATIIGEGSKIDNLVQIAHSVKLGKHNIVCAFTGIAGSTTSGDHVTFAANVGVSDHVTIDDRVILGARAGVPPNKHLIKDTIYLGNPARPRDKAIEFGLAPTRIPGIRKSIKTMGEKMEQLAHRLKLLEGETSN